MKTAFTSLRILLLILFIPLICRAQQVPQSEYLALCDFYGAMNGSGWSTKWNTNDNNVHEGGWSGVTVTDGHVTALTLDFYYINGAVPASFGNLKYLKTLTATYSNCNWSTTDLNVFAGLDSLTSLNLQNKRLKGVIPASWNRLTKLETVNLRSDSITGLAPGFCSLPNLKTLELYGNQISGLPAEFGNLSNLVTANLSNNKITAVPTSISNLKKVTTFNLSSNQISGAVIPEFADMTALTSLDMSSNQLSDVQAVFPSGVSFSIGSQILTSPVFTFTGDDVIIDLPRIMRYYRSGGTYNFDARNNFNVYVRGSSAGSAIQAAADGSLTIPTSYFSTLKSGDEVYIYQSGGTANGSRLNFATTVVNRPMIPQSEFEALRDFYTAMNGSSWSTQWDVSANNLHESPWAGVGINNGHITDLTLNFYNIDGAVPASFGNLKYLKTLTATYNNCNWSTTDLNVFAGLDSLTSLNLQNKQLAGVIPASWSNLVKLETLNLSYNNITGIPAEIGGMSSLKTLDLRNNKLENVDQALANLALTSVNFNNQTISRPIIEISGNRITIELPSYCTYALNAGVGSFNNSIVFNLLINDVNKTNAYSATDGTLTFNNVDQLGTINPSDRIKIVQTAGIANQTAINFAGVSFRTSPLLIRWQGGTSDSWNNPLNWNAEVPLSMDTVVIPCVGAGSYYPVLTGRAAVAEIRFEPGAQIGNQSRLDVKKAFVQYDLRTTGRWLMLSIPLGQAYLGDFTFGGYPVTWPRTFEMRPGEGSTTKGTWVTARGNTTPFTYGDGFVLWVDEDNSSVDKGLKLLHGIRELPFFHHHAAGSPDKELYDKVHQSHDYVSGTSTFYNYILDGSEYVRKESENYTVSRTGSAYQLAGGNIIDKELNFGTNSQAGDGVFALAGNPYMAVLDYKKLYNGNSNTIKDSYQVWTGVGYTVYTPEGTSGAVVEGIQDQLIAPLQSFIVEKRETGNTSLRFNETMTTVNRSVVLRSSTGNGNKLDIVASNPAAKVRTFIAKREGGKDTFGDLDSRKMISETGKVPEIYTLKPYKNGMIAAGSNIIDSDNMLIPVGLATSYKGEITLSFSGMDTYDDHLSLIDAEANKTFNLTGLASFDYIVKMNGKTSVCEDRFFIRISKTETGLAQEEAAKMNVYRANGLIHIVSGASNLIKEVVLYNLQGVLLHRETAIDAVSHTMNGSWPKGTYIVKVVSEKNIDNVKLIIY